MYVLYLHCITTLHVNVCYFKNWDILLYILYLFTYTFTYIIHENETTYINGF